ncbi:nicotinate-nucleotide adenylyltransferase [Virgibacillus byunsanensis]|uniref:Probable nicotinate-nucleotide adenylyltransferase n=1 Tax=Virgibacillus byunsanensis TaxID=570945 RepID=A0ABW3LM89_9BACI
MMRVGILGGTFDPPHIGHLIIAEEVRIALSLDEVWFIPSNEPPHKDKATIVANERFAMLQVAIENNSAFNVNSIEMDRLGKSYTFDTMKLLREKHPGIEFYFIIGADMVEFLPRWQNISDLVQMVTFVGVERPGYRLETDFPVKQVEIPSIEISSTVLRERLRNNQSVKYLIPQSVEAYIKEKQLYEQR